MKHPQSVPHKEALCTAVGTPFPSTPTKPDPLVEQHNDFNHLGHLDRAHCSSRCDGMLPYMNTNAEKYTASYDPWCEKQYIQGRTSRAMSLGVMSVLSPACSAHWPGALLCMASYISTAHK